MSAAKVRIEVVGPSIEGTLRYDSTDPDSEVLMPEANAVPADYPQITPYLCVDGGAAAIAFYEEVFGATERMRLSGPDGRIGHAELTIGSGLLMLADEHPEMGIRGPKAIGGTSVTISMYVDDVDAVFAKALAAGAVCLREVEDQFYGDRSGQLEDPFGHRWSLATRIEDVSAEEMDRRMTEMMSDADNGG